MVYLGVAAVVTIALVLMYRGPDRYWGSNEQSIAFGKFFVFFMSLMLVGGLIVFGVQDMMGVLRWDSC